jgi:hypothetical protein
MERAGDLRVKPMTCVSAIASTAFPAVRLPSRCCDPDQDRNAMAPPNPRGPGLADSRQLVIGYSFALAMALPLWAMIIWALLQHRHRRSGGDVRRDGQRQRDMARMSYPPLPCMCGKLAGDTCIFRSGRCRAARQFARLEAGKVADSVQRKSRQGRGEDHQTAKSEEGEARA